MEGQTCEIFPLWAVWSARSVGVQGGLARTVTYRWGVTYRISKSFVVESGHMLTKHPGRCRFPHGHSRTITLVVSSPGLDGNDMVCDFKALGVVLKRVCGRLDHSLSVNSEEPLLEHLGSVKEGVVVFEREDPTTEVLARRIYMELSEVFRTTQGGIEGEEGHRYAWPAGLKVERVRVSETATTWAEYEG